MRDQFVRSLAIGLLLILAACGGASTPATNGDNDGGDSEATAAPPADGGGDGGEIDDFCLNTDDEVSSALEVDVAESVSTPNPGFGGGCLYYDADGNLVHAIAVLPESGQTGATIDAAQDGGAPTIEGIGDDAVLMSDAGPLAFVKGEWIVSMGLGGAAATVPISGDPDAFRAALEELGRQAVGRLP